jgi:membrane fusion protein (multidrug efflux system)
VRDGLKGGERVVVDGVIRVRPGAPVRPMPAGDVALPRSARTTAPSGQSAAEAR